MRHFSAAVCLSVWESEYFGQNFAEEGENLGQKEGGRENYKIDVAPKGQKVFFVTWEKKKCKKNLLFRSGISASSQRRKKRNSVSHEYEWRRRRKKVLLGSGPKVCTKEGRRKRKRRKMEREGSEKSSLPLHMGVTGHSCFLKWRGVFFDFWSIPKGPTTGKFPFRYRQSEAVSECSGTCEKLLSPCLHLGMGFLFCRSLQVERENCAELSSAQVWERQQNLNFNSQISA